MNHKWVNDVCVHCGTKRKKVQDAKTKAFGVIKDSWWYHYQKKNGTAWRLKNPGCLDF